MAKSTKKLIAGFVIVLTVATAGYIEVSEIGQNQSLTSQIGPEDPERGECTDCN